MRAVIARRLLSLYIDVPGLRPGTVGAYAFAVVSVGVATVLRLALDPYLVGAQFVTFFPAVVITTLISGFGAGFLCAVLSTASADFFVLYPRWSFNVDDPANVSDLLLFGPLAAYCAMIIGRMRMAIEREQSERALRANKDRLQLALDAARLGWWQHEPRRGAVLGDTRFKEIFDLAADETPVEEIAKRMHPHDAERFWADRAAALDPADPRPHAHQYRVQRSDGEVRWVEMTTAGMPARDFGVIRDVTARKNAEEAQARLAAIVTTSADGIIGKTLDGIVTSWNEAAEQMFGYSAGEMIGQSIRRLIPADRQTEEDMILARLARGESIVRYEPKRVAKDGRAFDASVTISPVRDTAGHIIGAAKIIRDITERKAHEEQVRLLMREARHRAKNLLSLVQVVARQTTTREPADFVARFTERIQALAANQDLLVRNNWQGADVEDLVGAQLAHFADLVGSRIAVSGPKLHLNSAATQAIGLALHELATNAGKYGALSTNRGRVDVCWGTDDDTLTMSWRERDGPPVSPPERRGFGAVVMQEMVGRSVDGNVVLEYAPSGLTWRLTCPALSALEHPRS